MLHPFQTHPPDIQVPPALNYRVQPPSPIAIHNRTAGVEHRAVSSTIFRVPAEVEGISAFPGFNLGPGMLDVLLEIIPEPRL